MKKILLIEPDYRSKFPPLGLMKISTFHKNRGDCVAFARGREENLKAVTWDRIYISSLFTWELPRTLKTIKYYKDSVTCSNDLIVGGTAVTLKPDFILDNINCTVVKGQLDKPGLLGAKTPAIANFVPDYSILEDVDFEYKPKDAYFCRITKGCVRKCKFCAVPKLEPTFGFNGDVLSQVRKIKKLHGEKHDLVILDNNILGIDRFEEIITKIKKCGFEKDSKLNGKKRGVDFNQGIDARLINSKNAKLLASVCLSPVRLAFDFDGMERKYRKAVHTLENVGFRTFTNYCLFNFEDSPRSLYHRLRVNIELNRELGIRITGFPMRYIPIDSINRRHIGPEWRWKYLRGIQCILLATRGLVSPNPAFFEASFGESYEKFIEIISMPDRYIIYRNKNKEDAKAWRRRFIHLSRGSKEELFEILKKLNSSRTRKKNIMEHKKFLGLLEHYYPNGEIHYE